jgi:hypothetical protein
LFSELDLYTLDFRSNVASFRKNDSIEVESFYEVWVEGFFNAKKVCPAKRICEFCEIMVGVDEVSKVINSS